MTASQTVYRCVAQHVPVSFVRGLALSVSLFGVLGAQAEDLGSYGQTYTIKERDAIDAMKDAVAKKLANGGKERMIKGAQDRYLASLNNVVTPKGIGTVKENAVRYVDVSKTVEKTIRDTKGNIIVAAGTVINPLAIKPLTKKVFFIDARDDAQIRLVLAKADPADKVILLGGSVFEAGKKLHRPIYLDVPGFHTIMKIRALPSIVSQVGNKLQVLEAIP